MSFISSDALPTIGYIVKIFPKLSETFILQEILELERLGLNLVILSLRPPSDVDTHPHFHQLKAPVLYAPVVLNEGRGNVIQQSLWTEWVTEKVHEYGITHLHTHYVTEPTDIAVQVQVRMGIPYSFTTHAKDLFLSSKEDLSRKVNDAQFVLTCTEFNKDYLEQIVQSGTPVYCVYHGVDLDVFQPSTPKISCEDGERPLILSIGRFRPKKGFPILIQACASLKKSGYQFQCVLVGYGPLEQELKQMIHHLGLNENVRLSGKVARAGILDWYRKANLFVLPCQLGDDGDRDGIPNVLVEAMAMELPVVSTNIASIPELIQHEKTGLLVEQKDPLALAAAIGQVLDQPILGENLGKQGREKVMKSFSSIQNSTDIYNLFTTILMRSSGEGQTPEYSAVPNAT